MNCCGGEKRATFSWQIGVIYMINVMLGVGVLTVPKPFSEVGLILGLTVLCVLALSSYCTGTFVLETLSIYNACRLDSLKTKEDDGATNKCETELDQYVLDNKAIGDSTQDLCYGVPLPEPGIPPTLNNSLFVISLDAEMGDLCKLFFNKAGFLFYYVVVSIYLYGALSIEFAVVAKSLTSVLCGNSDSFIGNTTSPCKSFPNYTVTYMYRMTLSGFVVFWMPFVFFNITATKILQLITFLLRTVSLTSMSVLTFIRIRNGKINRTPNMANFNELANFVPIALYVFLCHTTIPPTLSATSNKNRLSISIMLPFAFVFIIAIFLCVPSIYAFELGEIQDLFTLNFAQPVIFKFILELYPVLTLSSNAPVTGVVLRDNLKTMFLSNGDKEYNFLVRKLIFPIIVIIPPVIIALSTSNVGLLVGYTGSFAGGIILYLVPSMLVYCARKKAKQIFGEYENRYRSPFHQQFWICLIIIWYFVTLGLVIYYKITG